MQLIFKKIEYPGKAGQVRAKRDLINYLRNKVILGNKVKYSMFRKLALIILVLAALYAMVVIYRFFFLITSFF